MVMADRPDVDAAGQQSRDGRRAAARLPSTSPSGQRPTLRAGPVTARSLLLPRLHRHEAHHVPLKRQWHYSGGPRSGL